MQHNINYLSKIIIHYLINSIFLTWWAKRKDIFTISNLLTIKVPIVSATTVLCTDGLDGGGGGGTMEGGGIGGSSNFSRGLEGPGEGDGEWYGLVEGVSLWGELTCSIGDSGGWGGEYGGVDGECTGEDFVSVGAGEGNLFASWWWSCGSCLRGSWAVDVKECNKFGGAGDGILIGSCGMERGLGFLWWTGEGALRTGGGGVSVLGGSGVRIGGSSSITRPILAAAGSFLTSDTLDLDSFFIDDIDGDEGLVSELDTWGKVLITLKKNPKVLIYSSLINNQYSYFHDFSSTFTI